ncbi:hypothetical protein LTR91_000235 [Friedmanniomyces endolithicus]|uniref:NADP-dependent oxidoreductase domain-containing protein n=1 Tax=Friedmanniomyces endolithicus TaxID=329885 RepID=A0AAN6R2W7_9PEZI|nr:hypothetical protein LTS09_008483 [Friedmanniomyces endolithicus]KAK0281171.1 hypothetical protein LTR35_007545 [Friedmanniomyces endolithicus]KAK0295133.1 hypothetical protein LTS00_006189 [Friedmanniomyces endolithicus]KAK0931286.1 hypothetical protein LTR57_000701 [Friedmanniomyces endolithicus]KAK1010435.1 hypothetical protein LTR54_005390 [Friedmanniomyces endolithicus]
MSLPQSFPLRVAGGKTIQIPSVGYGTWASGENSWAKDAVLTALKAGYRHLDCAWMYGVDEAVGEAIKESGIPREEIFVTTKFWPHFGHPDNVELCLDKILASMKLDYVDLYLAHWPCVWKPASREALEKAHSGHDSTPSDKAIVYLEDGKPDVDWEHSAANLAEQKSKKGSFAPTWKAMQACVRSGKAKAVGLSNFSITEIEELLPHEADVPIACNQIEVHPWLPQPKLVAFGHKHEIVTTCYSPFAGQMEGGVRRLEEAKVVELAKKNGMDGGQLLQSWAVQRGTVPLGKSATPARIKSNLDIRKLSDEDMEALDALAVPNGKGRTVDFTEKWGVPLFTG